MYVYKYSNLFTDALNFCLFLTYTIHFNSQHIHNTLSVVYGFSFIKNAIEVGLIARSGVGVLKTWVGEANGDWIASG